MVEPAYTKKGNDYMKEGEEALKGIKHKKPQISRVGGFLSNLFGNKSERAEKALDFFKMAATNFKMAKACTILTKAD